MLEIQLKHIQWNNELFSYQEFTSIIDLPQIMMITCYTSQVKFSFMVTYEEIKNDKIFQSQIIKHYTYAIAELN